MSVAEVPNGPGLLHRQGAADHRADVPEGPGGGDRGKRKRASLCLSRLGRGGGAGWEGGEKTLIIPLSCSIAERPPKTQSRAGDTGIFWQMRFHFLFIPPHSRSQMYLSPALEAVNTKLCLCFKEMDGFSHMLSEFRRGRRDTVP